MARSRDEARAEVGRLKIELDKTKAMFTLKMKEFGKKVSDLTKDYAAKASRLDELTDENAKLSAAVSELRRALGDVLSIATIFAGHVKDGIADKAIADANSVLESSNIGGKYISVRDARMTEDWIIQRIDEDLKMAGLPPVQWADGGGHKCPTGWHRNPYLSLSHYYSKEHVYGLLVALNVPEEALNDLDKLLDYGAAKRK